MLGSILGDSELTGVGRGPSIMVTGQLLAGLGSGCVITGSKRTPEDSRGREIVCQLRRLLTA